jgi:ribose 5-phosphate isomerase B
MKIHLAADHRGFEFKESVKKWLQENSYEVIDAGAEEYIGDDDYVDYATKALKNFSDDDQAILFCGSGHGMDIVANRYKNVRAILGFNLEVVKQGRQHENANVLVVPTDWLNHEELITRIKAFLETEFSNEERHVRRLQKIDSLFSNNHE